MTLEPFDISSIIAVKWLFLGQNFPGMRIGPEPTTDGFTVLLYSRYRS